MKVLHVNTLDNGGAAKSCIRLHLGLLHKGVDSKILFLHRNNGNIINSQYYTHPPVEKPPVLIPPLSTRIEAKTKRILKEFKLYKEPKKPKVKPKLVHKDYLFNRPEGLEVFSSIDVPFDITTQKEYQEADIINLHWIGGFLNYESFFKKNAKKIVWTLHDMNPFTGGCHYSKNCEGYKTNCLNCPQLQGTIDPNYSSYILNSKLAALLRESINIVSPSNWLLNASKSSLVFQGFKHHLIPYGLDTKIFKPIDRDACRDILGLPKDKIIILFVSDLITNARKGYKYLLEAFSGIKTKEKCLLCAIGSSTTSLNKESIYELGTIADERLMAVAYSAADIFVIPSLEDNLPNTVLEALMCGTPVIGFPVGGITDLIEHEKNGYLSTEISVQALTDSMNKFIDSFLTFDRNYISESAMCKYNLNRQAESYIKLYKNLL